MDLQLCIFVYYLVAMTKLKLGIYVKYLCPCPSDPSCIGSTHEGVKGPWRRCRWPGFIRSRPLVATGEGRSRRQGTGRSLGIPLVVVRSSRHLVLGTTDLVRSPPPPRPSTPHHRRPHPCHPPPNVAARKPDRAAATHRIATPLSVRSVRHQIHARGGEGALPPLSLLEYHGLVAISISTGIIDAIVLV
mgnify:CR=1 FL=1